MPEVPINPSAVERLSSYYLEKPGPVPMDLIIAVPQATFKPSQHKGALQCVSPDEVRIAYFGAIAKTVREWNAAKSGGLTPAAVAGLTQRVKQWRHHALSCTFEFKVLGSTDDIYFAAVNQREKLVTDYSSLAVSAYQRVFQVLNVKARKEEILGPLTAARVAEELNKHAHLAADFRTRRRGHGERDHGDPPARLEGPGDCGGHRALRAAVPLEVPLQLPHEAALHCPGCQRTAPTHLRQLVRR